MQLVKDYEQHKMYLEENDNRLIEFGFVADEYVIIFYTKDRVGVTKEVDNDFYNMYSKILTNMYRMPHKYSYQEKDKLVWFTDGYCDLDDEWIVSVKDRFCLEKEDNTLYFSAINPFFDKKNIMRYPRVVVFSPAGNGHFAVNKKTGSFLQDDIIMIHQNMLVKNKQKQKNRME